MGESYWHRKGKKVRGVGALESWLASDEAEVVYKNTFNLQTHVDIRDIAVMDKFLLSLGWRAKSQSDLGRTAFDLVINTAIKEGFERPSAVDEALDYLEERGYSLGQFMNSTAQRKRLSTALQRDALVAKRRELTDIPASVEKRRVLESMDEWTKLRYRYWLAQGQEESSAAVDAKTDARFKEQGRFEEIPDYGNEEAAIGAKTLGVCPEQEIPEVVAGANIDAQTTAQQLRAQQEAQAMKDYMANMIAEAKRRGQVIEPSK